MSWASPPQPAARAPDGWGEPLTGLVGSRDASELRLESGHVGLVAGRYAAAVARGSTRPVQELATRLRQPVARLRSRIQKARQLGFLDQVVQGHAGGRLTPAAKRLLKAKEGRDGKTTRTRRR